MEDKNLRQDLHKLLDLMLDEGKKVGNIAHMTPLDQGVKIIDITLRLQRMEYELPYPVPYKLNVPPEK